MVWNSVVTLVIQWQAKCQQYPQTIYSFTSSRQRAKCTHKLATKIYTFYTINITDNLLPGYQYILCNKNSVDTSDIEPYLLKCMQMSVFTTDLNLQKEIKFGAKLSKQLHLYLKDKWTRQCFSIKASEFHINVIKWFHARQKRAIMHIILKPACCHNDV